MSDAARRLFIALWPDDPVRQALFHWQVHNLPADLRWQHRADLHLTLHFLGQVEAARVEALRRLVLETQWPAFALVLDRIGHWPRPQVLWAGAAEVPEALAELHRTLGERLRGLGHSPEARAFRPHVTLARRARVMPAVGPLAPVAWSVAELTLVESVPGAVPHYRPLCRQALA